MYAKVINLINGEYIEDAFCPGFDYADEVFRAQVDGSEYLIPMISVVYIKVDKDKTMKYKEEQAEKLMKWRKGRDEHEIHD